MNNNLLNPRLFGINYSNRDFSKKETWGKNQFNSSFPASLCCFLESKGLDANYLKVSDSAITVSEIAIEDVFGISSLNENIFYSFEMAHTPYQRYVVGALPRTDLVIQRKSNGDCLTPLEIKLTALPDNTTCELSENQYGSEIVVRPDTIVYLACSVIDSKIDNLRELLKIDQISIDNWTDPSAVLRYINIIVDAIDNLSNALEDRQIPFLLQPIWKTQGKSPKLADNCLDVFIWSNAAFIKFITKISDRQTNALRITRQTRTTVWLYKMLMDFCGHASFDHNRIIDELSYNTKNDKAFASSGNVTNTFMSSAHLTNPRILKNEIKDIILGGGQNLLSPERRFDAIIYNSPELFNI